MNIMRVVRDYSSKRSKNPYFYFFFLLCSISSTRSKNPYFYLFFLCSISLSIPPPPRLLPPLPCSSQQLKSLLFFSQKGKTNPSSSTTFFFSKTSASFSLITNLTNSLPLISSPSSSITINHYQSPRMHYMIMNITFFLVILTMDRHRV